MPIATTASAPAKIKAGPKPLPVDSAAVRSSDAADGAVRGSSLADAVPGATLLAPGSAAA